MSSKRILRTLLPLICCAALVTAQQDSSTGTPDNELGLSRASVFDTPAPDAVRDRTSDPGDDPILPRTHDGSPPLVPHGVADFLPITRNENLCVDCHLIEEAADGDPTPIPASHFTDYRRAPDQVGDELAGARYLCVSCHVAPGSSTPLPVDNTFQSTSEGTAPP